MSFGSLLRRRSMVASLGAYLAVHSIGRTSECWAASKTSETAKRKAYAAKASASPKAALRSKLQDSADEPSEPPEEREPGAAVVPEPQQPAEDSPQAKARPLYEAGARAFADGRNAEAIVFFRRAAQVLPSPQFTYNIGLAFQDMGDPGNAIFHFLSYLQQQPNSERRKDVLQRIELLEQQLAASGIQHLAVSTTPAGALLFVDQVAQGVTPYSGQFSPGSHDLLLQLKGYQQRATTVHLQPDHAFEVRLTLQPEALPRLDTAPTIRPLTWSFLAVGVGSLAAGVIFEVARSNARSHSRESSSTAPAARFAGEADAHQIASLSLLGFGSAMLIAGGVIALDDLAVQPSDNSSTALNFQLPCGNQFCGASATGRF